MLFKDKVKVFFLREKGGKQMYKFQIAVTYPEGENEVESRGPQLYLKYLISIEYFKTTERKKRREETTG